MKKLLAGIVLFLTPFLSFNSYAQVDDRILHTGVSVVVGSATLVTTGSKSLAYATCAAAGIGKEIYDEVDYGGASVKDLAFDAIGCFVGIEGTAQVYGVRITPKVSSNWMGLNFDYFF